MKLKIDKKEFPALMDLLKKKGIDLLSVNGENNNIYVEITSLHFDLIRENLYKLSIREVSE